MQLPKTLIPMLLLTLGAAGCRDERPAPVTTEPAPAPAREAATPETRPDPAPAARPAPAPGRAAAIAHGGVGSDPSYVDGCRQAVDAALAALEGGADPVAAAVAGAKILEDDPRYNAGTGSRVRIDGETVQMDAAVMDSAGRFGAVAVIERVRNPVEVAAAVIDSPHLLLAGDGATRFARTLGMPDYDPSTERTRALTRDIQRRLREADPTLPARWRDFDWRKRWNFEKTLEDAGLAVEDTGSDTIGVAVRAADGRFAVALSTGGTSITLRGRVGDVPIYGAGLFAGPHGAVAATGVGERIIEQVLSRTTHGWMAEGLTPAEAAQRGVALIRDKGAVGLIVIGREELAGAADRPMAWAGREAGSSEWSGPAPP